MHLGLLLSDTVTLALVIVAVPAILVAYIFAGEFIVRRLPDRARGQVRPWIWVGPALLFVCAFLLAPAIVTVLQSFQNHAGSWLCIRNYLRHLAALPTCRPSVGIPRHRTWRVPFHFP